MEYKLEKYPWLKHQYIDLVKKYIDNKLHPIILFKTYKNIGTSRLIHNIIQFFLCQNKNFNHSCNKCISCYLMKNKKHPDFYSLNQSLDSNLIGINDIKEMLKYAYLTSKKGGDKIIWISNINNMTKEAKNALLKTIEEPPIKTRFFLQTYNISKLLLTLRSRSYIYKINKPKEQEGFQWIKKKNIYKDNIYILTALRLYENNPKTAYFFLKNSYFLLRVQLIKKIKKYFYQYNNTKLCIFMYNKNLLHFITWICTILLDAIKIKIFNKKILINIDCINFIKDISKNFNTSILIKSLKSWLKCRYFLKNSNYLDKKIILIEQILYWNHILKKI